MRAVLLAWGVTSVIGAESVAQAEEFLEEHKIDMIFCDLNMPGEDGLSLLRWVRHNEYAPTRRLPFALMTSETTQLNISRAACCGADMVIEKPLKPMLVWPRMITMLTKSVDEERALPPCGKVLEAPCPLIPLARPSSRRSRLKDQEDASVASAATTNDSSPGASEAQPLSKSA